MPQTYPFKLEPLLYSYDALAPYISSETLHFHHDKHLQTYTDNLNKALEAHPELQNKTLEQLLARPKSLPSDVRTPIMRNAGGVYNHIFYFNHMRPATRDNRPSGKLLESIQKESGSFEQFQKEFKEHALAVFGSGWLWLVANASGKLMLSPSANQDSPITEGYIPIATIDVWEHAYYLDYQNRRTDYIDGWWNLVNWEAAQREYEALS